MKPLRAHVQVLVASVAAAIGGAALGAGVATHPASAPATRPVVPSQVEIRQAVRQLNHPSVTRRREAIRQLAEWGPLAFGELEQAASGTNLEEALSARDLLRELESAILIGARVRLEVKPARVAWDQPVTLIVHAENPTPGPIRVPWPAEAPTTRPGESLAEASQVAGMMDASDFLVVKGPDEEAIDLRVEPIDRDPGVYRAVNVRAGDRPPSQVIPAGARSSLTIPQFNRGWARYPMLRPGRYSIQLAYQPEWKDPSWTESGFGLVLSEPVTIEVTSSAPEPVIESSIPLLLDVVRTPEGFAAELQSTWDAPTWVNLNVGGHPTTHGRLEWQIASDESDFESVVIQSDGEDAAFEADRVVRLDPGAKRVISRLTRDTLDKRLRELSVAPSSLKLTARYANIAAPVALRERLKELGREAPVPTHLYTGSAFSEPVPVTATAPE